jgi:hypothetical protein
VYELLKTPNDELETDPNEAAYQEQKEAVRNAVKEVRGKKEALQNLGIDVDNLEDQALITAVNQAQEEASAIIREFLVQHPESNIPEALSARGARIGTLEGSLEMLKKREEELGQWGREHIGPYINSSTDPQQLVEGTLTEITRSQEYIDQDKAKLASTEIYRDLLETPGIMEDPVVKSAYERSLAANDEERDLEKKLDAVNRKPTTRFFGYTAEKKAEELAAAKRDLVKAKEEAAPANAAYSAACSSYHERLSAFGDVFSRGDQGKGGYEKKRTELKAKIAEGEQRLASQNQQLESARHYREARQALDLERATQTEELTILKAAAQAAARE